MPIIVIISSSSSRGGVSSCSVTFLFGFQFTNLLPFLFLLNLLKRTPPEQTSNKNQQHVNRREEVRKLLGNILSDSLSDRHSSIFPPHFSAKHISSGRTRSKSSSRAVVKFGPWLAGCPSIHRTFPPMKQQQQPELK